MTLKPTTELVALAIAVVATGGCVYGLGAATWPWLGWALGLVLSVAAAARLGARVLDDRTNRQAAERARPEPPAPPASRAADQSGRPAAGPLTAPPDQQY